MARSRTRQLDGAPRRSKYARTAPGSSEERRIRGGIALVVALFAFVLGGAAGWATQLNRQLHGGILEQRLEHRGRPDWVRLERLPRHVVTAVLAATGPEFFNDRPPSGFRNSYLARDLVRQVHLLGAGPSGEARTRAMGPLLESQLSSRALVELYVNRAYMGRERSQPIHGVHHAAREFFGKSPQQLSVSEAATLAGLMLPPRIENPRAYPGAVGARRNEVLRRMFLARQITAPTLQQALREPLGFQPGLRFQPMARPRDWDQELEPIRLPPEILPLSADTTGAAPTVTGVGAS